MPRIVKYKKRKSQFTEQHGIRMDKRIHSAENHRNKPVSQDDIDKAKADFFSDGGEIEKIVLDPEERVYEGF